MTNEEIYAIAVSLGEQPRRLRQIGRFVEQGRQEPRYLLKSLLF